MILLVLTRITDLTVMLQGELCVENDQDLSGGRVLSGSFCLRLPPTSGSSPPASASSGLALRSDLKNIDILKIF